MRTNPTLILAGLAALLAAAAFTPVASAAVNPPTCAIHGDATTLPSCTFSCQPGDTIHVQATTNGPSPGTEYPRIHATCGGVDVYCQTQTACQATSSGENGIVTSSDNNGRCYAQTVYVDGSCTASGTSKDVDPVLNDVDNAVADADALVADVESTINNPPATITQTVPPQDLTQGVPAVSTPGVGPQSATLPGVTVPAVCTLGACVQPTVVPAQSTPALPLACTPAKIVCVGPVGSFPLTPPVSVDPICANAGAICQPIPVLGPQTVTTPAVPSIGLTPPASVTVSTDAFSLTLVPNAGQTTLIGPFPLQVGPVPVVLCASGCPAPVLPAGSGSGSITVSATVDGQTYAQTIPVSF